MSEYLNIGLDITGLLDNSPTHGKGPALIMCRGIKYMPVRHGKWIRTGQSYINPNKFLCLTCSCCLSDLDEHIREEPRYCPNCGALMRENESEE